MGSLRGTATLSALNPVNITGAAQAAEAAGASPGCSRELHHLQEEMRGPGAQEGTTAINQAGERKQQGFTPLFPNLREARDRAATQGAQIQGLQAGGHFLG